MKEENDYLLGTWFYTWVNCVNSHIYILYIYVNDWVWKLYHFCSSEHMWKAHVNWQTVFVIGWSEVLPVFLTNTWSQLAHEFVQFYSSPKALKHNAVLLGQYPFCHLGLYPSGAAVKVLYFNETEGLNWPPTESQIPKHQLFGSLTVGQKKSWEKCSISDLIFFFSVALFAVLLCSFHPHSGAPTGSRSTMS